MDRPVLLPQHHQIDARPLQLTGQRGPIRLPAPAEAAPDAGMGKQTLFKNGVGQVARQRPRQPGSRGTLEIVLDRAARHPERAPDLPALTPSRASRSICRICRMVSSLLAGIRFPSLINEGLDDLSPEGLTQTKTPTSKNPTGFKS